MKARRKKVEKINKNKKRVTIYNDAFKHINRGIFLWILGIN